MEVDGSSDSFGKVWQEVAVFFSGVTSHLLSKSLMFGPFGPGVASLAILEQYFLHLENHSSMVTMAAT